MPVTTRLAAITLDCPDPRQLVAFYGSLTGWPVLYEDDDFAAIGAGEALAGAIGFQRVEEYTAPRWPGQGQPQQSHLDFYVDTDLDTAEAAALVLGATKADPQPTPDQWRVMLDPAGHPFCLCLESDDGL
jgi:catechol 2,3-dioxygenase-like lactoylglutathione lyase family enzyme